jgi:hypothetical protein
MLVCLTIAVFGSFLLPAARAGAATDLPDDGVVIWNEDYTLAAGEELDGDLVVFGGDATLEPGSRVEGNAVIWGGSVEVGGVVEGSVVASNGDVQLGKDARVHGDVVCTWNCDIERQEGARVDGEVVGGPSLRGIPFGRWDRLRGLKIEWPFVAGPLSLWVSGPRQVLAWMFRIMRTVMTILVVSAVGGLVGLIWPKATARVGRTAFQSPGASLGVGFLTIVAAVTLIIALAITICLSPAAALVALALGAALLFGWIAVGARVGGRVLEALGAGQVLTLWVAGLGTLIITLTAVGLSAALCLAPLGWLLMFAVGCFGLGAVVLSRFGSTEYVPGQRSQADSAPPTRDVPEDVAEGAVDSGGGDIEVGDSV